MRFIFTPRLRPLYPQVPVDLLEDFLGANQEFRPHPYHREGGLPEELEILKGLEDLLQGRHRFPRHRLLGTNLGTLKLPANHPRIPVG